MGKSTSEHNKPDNELSLSSKDAQVLEWYFSEGKSSFAHSVTGPMLSKAELYRYGSFRCYLCEEYPGIDAQTGLDCKRCKGVGFHTFEIYKKKDEITAYPTAEVVEARGYEPSITVLQKYGRVSRRLDVVKAIAGNLAIQVLEAYHGDTGARWGRTRHGRNFALYSLTAAGKKILERMEKDDTVSLSPTEKLGVLAELSTIQPDKKQWRKELMDKAEDQARILYQDAINAWMQAGAVSAKPKKANTPKKKRPQEPWVPNTPSKEKGVTLESIKETVGTI